MFNNSSKMLFMFTLMIGTMIAISANSWFGAWMGLEINLLSFIPLMIDSNNSLSTEASLKYFLVQALASTVFLFFIIMLMFLINLNFQINFHINYFFLLINSTLLLKSGTAPFHFWFPEVMEGLSWFNNLILMTWQKIAPLMLISYIYTNKFFIFIIIISIIIGSFGGLSQTSLRKILAFSSINHLGWMLAAMNFSDNLWLIYFLIYLFLSITLTYSFNSCKLSHINQTFSFNMNFPLLKFFMMLSLLSLGGLPPFLGFLPKWLVIQSMTENNMIFLISIMVIFTLLTLYYYMRICYSAFLLSYWKPSWNFKQYNFNFKIKIMLLLNFLSLTGLILFNLNFIMQ